VTLEINARPVVEGPFHLGEWLVEPRLNRLIKDTRSIQIELKMMDVLVCLADHAGELVERQELIDTVWATEFISENILTRAIAELRSVLGDDARNPSFIETIHRRGYRLIAPIEAAVSDEAATAKVARFPVPDKLIEEERSPYPGLASFTKDDAEYFFGREAEVAQMWRKITTRRLLAVIGPSGVGKSSLLRAGLITSAPEGWGTLICHPGEAPFAALARLLAPEFEGDTDAIGQLVDITDEGAALALITRWRERFDQALLIIDQFEELFTLNIAEVQARFANLLGRLAREADVHVLLSMRDDFHFRCHEHEALAPVFDAITPIATPKRADLRRAVTEPAAHFGFTFEDEATVEDMLDAVEGERGGLPLLAFTVARLWEGRNKDTRRLTRDAYEAIGGVHGALAQHAEATLSAIGTPELPIVREIFRNLVTAEGTRAAREWNELLSIFDVGDVGRAGSKLAPTKDRTTVRAGFAPAREKAEEVVRALIDARLLTSYEVKEEDSEPRRRVEIIHESLLASWPRLVRWQTQDADAAQFRDQLRQAAKTWDERGRTDDMMWTGSAYREFAVWRERYPGGLTGVEGAFAAAMTSFATRRRRRRRIAAAAVLTIAVVVVTVFATLWRRSVLETRRAEAAKLLALAQVRLETDPAEALAYATASLELADTLEARIFAVRGLWAGPPLRALDLGRTAEGKFPVPAFSPDGRWLAVAGLVNENVLVYGEDGRQPVVLGGHGTVASDAIHCAWTGDGLLVTGHWTEGRARVWAMPEGRLVGLDETDPGTGHKRRRLRSWRLAGGEPEELGTVDRSLPRWAGAFDPTGRAWVYAKGDSILARPLPVHAGVPDRVIARHSSRTARIRRLRRSQGLYSSDIGGEIVLWTAPEGTSVPGRRLRKPETATTRLKPDPAGRWAVDGDGSIREGKVPLWNLEGLAGARPIELRRSGGWYFSYSDFHPAGTWVVATTNDDREVSFWPLQGPFSVVVDGYKTRHQRPVEIMSDGRYLVTHWGQDRVRLWPLPGAGDRDAVDMKLPDTSGRLGLAVDPTGKNVLVTGHGTQIFLVSLTGAEPRRLEGLVRNDAVRHGAFSPSGRLVAAASEWAESRATLRVWDLSSGESRAYDQPQGPAAERSTHSIAFVDETTLYTSGTYGLLRWNLETGTYERILESPPGGWLHLCMASDRRTILVSELDASNDQVGVVLFDLTTGEARKLDIPGGQQWAVALSPDGMAWASGEKDGSIWIGRTDGGEAHLLAGHEGPVDSVAISPDNKWIASSGDDKTLRLWPMPDLSKPPLHTLPRDELIAKLHTLTNLRAVRDPDSPSAWKLEVGPFPGWAEVPTW
jgi:DNA-binding winged helix-turn-helix (wHTH) protein/WD40 repeat protein